MSASYSFRIVSALVVASGGILCSVNHSAANPPSSFRGAAPTDARKTTVRQQRFKSLDEAIARTEDELNVEHSFEVAVIVFTISTPNEQTALARTELHFLGPSAGYLPGRISTSEAVLQPVIIRRSTQPVELHIISPGFDTYIRRVILHAGELIIWDDIVLDPITEQSAASVMGRVRLEGEEANLEGLLISIDQEAVTFTDASGYFVADPVRAGKLSVSTHKPGYWGLRDSVEVAAGEQKACALVGYRVRYAHVRWAYQPDGTRNFDGGIRTGEAVLSPKKLSRVSFAKGFKQVSGRSDFLITQRKDQLVLRHSDVRGNNIPASMLVKNTSFDELYEAPESEYERTDAPLRPGDLYVFHCYDGKHYAMMEVLDITDKPPSPAPR